MACIGSVIIDQIIFREDVEKKQLTLNQQLVDSILPSKTNLLKGQIRSVDTLIFNKEAERAALQRELDLRPTISLASSAVNYQKDSTGKYIQSGKSNSSTAQVNPKLALMQPLQDQINAYIDRKAKMETQMISIREDVTKEVTSKTGFLDELEVLFSILFASNIALAMWLLWFLLLLSIELFVLLAKYGDSTHDYERTVLHQMEVKLEMLGKLRSKPEIDNFINNK